MGGGDKENRATNARGIDPEIESKCMYVLTRRTGISWLELETWPPHWVRALISRVLDEIKAEQRVERKRRGVFSLGDIL